MTSLILFVLAVAVRAVNFSAVLPGEGKYYLFDPDCYMRLRKVMIYLAAFPRPVVHDYFQGYPQGTGIISSPAMEYLLATILFPFTGREINEWVLAAIMSSFPAILGGVTVVIMYHMVKKWCDGPSAVISALFLAFLPIHIETTLFGRFDNEMTESLMFLLVIMIYLETYKNDTQKNWLMLGALQVLFVILWRGALVPLSILGLDIIARIFSEKEPGRIGRHAATSYLIPAAVFALLCISNIWGGRNLFTFNIVSWFHVLLFFIAGTAIAISGCSRQREHGYLKTALFLFVFLAIAGLMLLPQIKQGISVAMGDNAWVDSIAQYLPVWKDKSAIYRYGLFPLATPVVAWIALMPARNPRLPRRFLLTSLAVIFVMAVLRRRFGLFMAIEAALVAGLLTGLIQERLRLSRNASIAATAALLLMLQIPTIQSWSIFANKSTGPIKGDLEESLLWLRYKTPAAGDSYRPDIFPVYSVLSNWDLGGYIETIARRPSVATNYGTETYGMAEAGRLFLSTESNEMTSILDRNRSRYLLLYNPLDKLVMYTRLLNVPNIYMEDKWDPARGEYAFQPKPAALQLAIVRLFVADGSYLTLDSMTFPPIEGVRLVHESTTPADLGALPLDVRQVKIFERTRGMRILLPKLEGCQTIAEQQVVTNRQRLFTYRNLGKLSGDGNVTLVIPYPPRTGQDSTGAVGPAKITCGSRNIFLDVAADTVNSGKELTLSWK